MKNSFRIILAALLIAAGVLSYRSNRPRPLTDCLPQETWDHISCRERTLDLSPEDLKKAMESITVFPGREPDNGDCASLTLKIRTGEQSALLTIREDGAIAVINGDAVCFWREADAELFQLLTDPE